LHSQLPLSGQPVLAQQTPSGTELEEHSKEFGELEIEQSQPVLEVLQEIPLLEPPDPPEPPEPPEPPDPDDVGQWTLQELAPFASSRDAHSAAGSEDCRDCLHSLMHWDSAEPPNTATTQLHTFVQAPLSLSLEDELHPAAAMKGSKPMSDPIPIRTVSLSILDTSKQATLDGTRRARPANAAACRTVSKTIRRIGLANSRPSARLRSRGVRLRSGRRGLICRFGSRGRGCRARGRGRARGS